MDPRIGNQQPIARTVGRRTAPPVGEPPNAAARAAWTRAPKGVFIYASHDEMTKDRERWTVEAIVAAANNV